MDETTKPSKPEKKNGYSKLFATFREFAEKRVAGDRKVAIFTHPSPDPDAIGSMMGVAWMLRKLYDVECNLFVSGCVSHPQNLTMVNLLAPKLTPADEFCSDEHGAKILVDVVPSNAGKGRKEIEFFDLIIDHHVDPQVMDSRSIYMNLHTGSCCSTIYHLMRFMGLEFDAEEDEDQQVATALMVGIYTDTGGLLADRMTEYDHEAYGGLSAFRDTEKLQQIAHFKLPRAWVVMMADAAKEATVTTDGLAVVGLGMLTGKHRDLIAVMANAMLTWEGVRVSVVFATVDGEMIQGSVRSESPSISAAKLAQELGEERGGNGWGHADSGGYRYSLGGLSMKLDDDQVAKDDTWTLCKSRETGRILKLLKK